MSVLYSTAFWRRAYLLGWFVFGHALDLVYSRELQQLYLTCAVSEVSQPTRINANEGFNRFFKAQ